MHRPLKIVFFTASSLPQGTYFRSHNLAIALQAQGHCVTVLAFNTENSSSSREFRDGVEYHLSSLSQGQRWFGHHSHPLNVLSQLWKKPPVGDIYHVFQPFPITCLPALWSRKRCRALIYDWDDFWAPGLQIASAVEKQPYLKFAAYCAEKIEEFMPAKADGVTACSTFLYDLALRRGANHAQVVHNGFWPGQDRKSKQVARKQLGLDPDAYYYGFMGRTTGEVDWCLDPLRHPDCSSANVRVALCGMPKSALPQLPKHQAERLNHCGILKVDEARVFADALDCGLLPLDDISFNQSRFPIKYVDYLSAGINVIASDVGEIATLSRSIPEVSLAPATRQGWRETVFAHIQSPKHKQRAVRQDFSRLEWPTLAQTLAGYYQSTLGETPELGIVPDDRKTVSVDQGL